MLPFRILSSSYTDAGETRLYTFEITHDFDDILTTLWVLVDEGDDRWFSASSVAELLGLPGVPEGWLGEAKEVRSGAGETVAAVPRWVLNDHLDDLDDTPSSPLASAVQKVLSHLCETTVPPMTEKRIAEAGEILGIADLKAADRMALLSHLRDAAQNVRFLEGETEIESLVAEEYREALFDIGREISQGHINLDGVLSKIMKVLQIEPAQHQAN